jgi:peptide deformylase
MAVLPIYNCFHPVMKQKSEPVTEFNQEIKELVDSLYDTLYNADNGIGLAAPQVGALKQIFVLDLKEGKGAMKNTPITMINPVIEEFSDELWEYQEGCLSVPTLYENIDRPRLVQVRYLDADMKEQKIEADKLLSRVIQHEFDHLEGILFFERLSALKRTLIKNRLRKIQKGLVEANYPMLLPDGKLAD